jgi:lysozyme
MNARGNENLVYFQNVNVRAFAYMIMCAEGTTANDYFTMFGGSRLSSLESHPGTRIINGVKHSAAGAFQFLASTWANLKSKLALTDFSETSQNAAFVELLRGRKALAAVMSGDVVGAVYLVRKEWASLPGAGYGQRERTLSQVQEWYQSYAENPHADNFTQASNSTKISPAAVIIGLTVLYLIFE